MEHIPLPAWPISLETDGERSLAIYDVFDRVGMWRVYREAAAVGAGI
ncbi:MULTISPECIES: hypothetical protein [Mesorhizobium]|nr:MULTISPECIES: hypothetical protein [Mesorhizobium]ESY64032.1 hypothetical protein X742_26970 [Mesorhizobium sp. LNHC232B00]WJI35744.1 hypothetical protein NL534_17600 [Mesorhizobium opportunistum]